MDLTTISHIVEETNAKTVEKYLSVGWVIFGSSHGCNSEGYPETLYSLGWPSEKGDIVKPELDISDCF